MNAWEHELRLEALLARGVDKRILSDLREQRNGDLLQRLEEISDDAVAEFNRLFRKSRAANTVYCVTDLGPSDDVEKLVVKAELSNSPIDLGFGVRYGGHTGG